MASGLVQVPEGAKTIRIQLVASEDQGPRQTGYLVQRSPEPLEEVTALPAAITEQYSGKDFSAYEIVALSDGTRYLAVLNEDKNSIADQFPLTSTRPRWLVWPVLPGHPGTVPQAVVQLA